MTGIYVMWCSKSGNRMNIPKLILKMRTICMLYLYDFFPGGPKVIIHNFKAQGSLPPITSWEIPGSKDLVLETHPQGAFLRTRAQRNSQNLSSALRDLSGTCPLLVDHPRLASEVWATRAPTQRAGTYSQP